MTRRARFVFATFAATGFLVGCDAILGISGSPEIVPAGEAGARAEAGEKGEASGGGTCTIQGTYAAGASDPDNPCQSCQPQVSPTNWTNVSNGTSCGAGEVCDYGQCREGCEIEATFRTNGTVNPTNQCQSCQSEVSATGWSPTAEGASCGTDQYCHAGACIPACVIAGQVYPAGAPSTQNACDTCQPSVSATSFSPAADGTSCAAGEICHSTTCVAGCEVSGVFYTGGAANPDNPCQSCQPMMSTTGFSPSSQGAACGDAGTMICASGVCATPCVIDGGKIPPGTADPSNSCASCQPTVEASGWSSVTNGTSCGSGEVCNGGACEHGCYVDAGYYPGDARAPGNVCLVCDPAASTTAFGHATGASCGTGMVCSGATCISGCYISGVVADAGGVDPTNKCVSCQPSTSASAWTAIPNDTGKSCASGKICIGATCASACDVDGGVLDAGAERSNNGNCQTCNPSESATEWSADPGGSHCGSACCSALDFCADTTTGKCCGNVDTQCGTTCCPSGQFCGDESTGTCCQPGDSACGSTCCPAGMTCLSPTSGTCGT